jgi:hypothetical protein
VAEGVNSAPGKSYVVGIHHPRPTDYRGRPVLILNADWAVGDDGALQWLLLRRAGRDWHPRRFHVQRDALLRSIRELCGGADPGVVETIGDWSALYRSSDHATGWTNG